MSAPAHLQARYIEVVEPALEACPALALPPEGNVKIRNYRLVTEGVRVYTPTGDLPKDHLIARFEANAASPSRSRILELVRPDDPGCDALEDIVRPTPRRGLARPFDEDTRRFLQRVLHSPSPYRGPEPPQPELAVPVSDPTPSTDKSSTERSLADELKEAEEGFPRDSGGGESWAGGSWRAAVERERLGRLALSVEEDEAECGGLGGAARRLDALLAESRALHADLAAIHQDLQAQSARACRCAAAARALTAEAHALRYLDDVLALLRGDVASAVRTRAWPFAIGRRQPGRNYIV